MIATCRPEKAARFVFRGVAPIVSELVRPNLQ
jgi:hypothetical protein